jgi:DNA-binding IclR family transcriptional regulator
MSQSLGTIQRTLLAAITAEPGQWSTVALADDLAMPAHHCRRVLKSLQKRKLVVSFLRRWYPER